MPGRFQAVPGVNTGWALKQATLHDSDHSRLWTRRWAYQGRGPTTNLRLGGGRWPSRSGFASDPAAPVAPQSSGLGSSAAGDWEPWEVTGLGTQSLKTIMGRCVDVSDVAVPNAVVQGFLTATDEFQRETTANADGYYELNTDKVGQAHYLVAYKAGSPDIAGTTVNTLVPTNRDGT